MEAEVLHKKKALVPKLRFKGFVSEWSYKSFSEMTQFINGKAYRQEELLSEGKYKVLRVGNLFSKSDWYYSDLELEENKYVNNGDLMYAWSASFGPHFWLGPKTIYHYHIWKVIPSHHTDKQFLFHAFQVDLEKIKSQSQGGTMFHITKGNIEQRKFCFPTLPEQEKIASFLSAVDKKIHQLSRKQELLEQYKKGVMQQLFSGKLRFKDENGKAFEKWDKKKLGDVADVKRGAASQHLNYVSDETKGVRLLRINDFLSDGAVYVENTEEMKRYTVRTNDLLIAGTGATAGIIFIVPEKFNNLSFSYNAPRIRVTNAYHTFIYYYLKSDIILKQQKRLFVGNAQPFLDTDAMRGFKIELPSIEEQKKIANYLTHIDKKIGLVAETLEATQTFKKGLLQQMFV